LKRKGETEIRKVEGILGKDARLDRYYKRETRDGRTEDER